MLIPSYLQKLPVKIQRYGRYFPTDTQGQIINDCHLEHITEPWRSLVTAWQEGYLGIFAELDQTLVSLYLRGSIPRGLAVAGLTDLDGIVVIRGGVKSSIELDIELDALKVGDNWQHRFDYLHQNLRSHYQFCTSIESQIISETDLVNPEMPWGRLLKMQGLPIWGLDHRHLLPSVTLENLGTSFLSHAPYLQQDIADTCAWLRHPEQSNPAIAPKIRHKCAWLSRRFLRSGFELVMEQELTYTRDLYLCYESFARYFPEREREMRQVLGLAINPSSDRPGLLVFWQEFGGWLITQIQESFQT